VPTIGVEMKSKKTEELASVAETGDPEDFLAPVLGRLLLTARKSNGMKQETLAKKIGVNDATLRRIESGQGSMRPRYVRAICTALGLDYSELVTEALFTFWNNFRATGSAPGTRPVQFLRERILARVDAHQKTERDLVEAYLDFESFVHFKTKFEDQTPES
jgi:transcriptional regulator with XRE-family HTH domain